MRNCVPRGEGKNTKPSKFIMITGWSYARAKPQASARRQPMARRGQRGVQLTFTVTFGRLCYLPIDCTSSTNHPFSRATMSTSTSTTSRSDLASIFDSAIQAYKRKTGNDITTHPLAIELQSCHSPDAVLAVLRNQVSVIGQPHSVNDSESFSKWLIPTVNVLYAFSATLGEGVGLVNITIPLLLRKSALTSVSQAFSPARVVFAGIGVLLQVRTLSPYCSPFSCRSFSRRSKMSALAGKPSPICSTGWNFFSAGSRFTPWCHSLRV